MATHKINKEEDTKSSPLFRLQPLSTILVRDGSENKWKRAIYSHFDERSILPFKTTTMSYRYGIPYNDETKHLEGTTNEALSKYIIW